MPSIAAHMAVAKLVGEKLKINDSEFIKGNLLPDIILKKNSHYHKKKGTYFLIPDTDYFRNNFDLHHPQHLGYYVHLLLDRYFLEQFVPKNMPNLDVFQDKTIYNDYNLVNNRIVKKFNLDVEYLKTILKNFTVEINKEKLNYNLECLSIKDNCSTACLNFLDFSIFLYDISQVISKEIDNYGSETNRVLLRSR